MRGPVIASGFEVPCSLLCMLRTMMRLGERHETAACHEAAAPIPQAACHEVAASPLGPASRALCPLLISLPLLNPPPPQGMPLLPMKLPKILGEDVAGVVLEAPLDSKVPGPRMAGAWCLGLERQEHGAWMPQTALAQAPLPPAAPLQ